MTTVKDVYDFIGEIENPDSSVSFDEYIRVEGGYISPVENLELMEVSEDTEVSFRIDKETDYDCEAVIVVEVYHSGSSIPLILLNGEPAEMFIEKWMNR